MYFSREKALFENRDDAGRQLATRLSEHKGKSVVVLAIPNGGVPIGLQIARALEADFDVVISRKIPLPLNPEAGFGAVADDGSVILNEELVRRAGLTREQIDDLVSKVRGDIRQRSLLYRKDRPLAILNKKTVIIVDDGLASGFTMKAAVESVRRHRPREIVVAVPVASASAMRELEGIVDKIVTIALGSRQTFAVADFYRHWYDVSDDDVTKRMREWQTQHSGSNIGKPENRFRERL